MDHTTLKLFPAIIDSSDLRMFLRQQEIGLGHLDTGPLDRKSRKRECVMGSGLGLYRMVSTTYLLTLLIMDAIDG